MTAKQGFIKASDSKMGAPILKSTKTKKRKSKIR